MASPSPAVPKGAVRGTAALLSAVVLVALNLRLALSSLPAVATSIQAETGWNDAFLGALTTIPVLCMGIFALAVPRLAQRIGPRSSVSLALIFMTVAMGLRLVGAVAATLLVSALLAGVSIAIIGGLVPGIVRAQLSHSMGTATSLWTTAMMGGAALGAAATLPLSELLGGWNRALAFWALPAIAGLIAWWAVERKSAGHERPASTVSLRDLPWRNRTAWALTAFMTLNSIVFYSTLAWIAPSYTERGYTPQTASLFFGAFTAMQVVAGLLLPRLSHAVSWRRTLFGLTIVLTSAALTSIALAPELFPPLTLAVLGFNLSGGFAMSLGLLSDYAADAEGSARLTAMAFSITYVVAAFGPFIAGVIMDTVNSWPLVFLLLAAATIVQLLAVPFLKRNVTIS